MINRRTAMMAGAAALASFAGAAASAAAQTAPTADDMVLGSANAPVTLIEYASASCPHCAHFHETVFPQLKANYIDTGRVRLIFREMLTEPGAVALAGFQVSRCNSATPDQYFSRLNEIFADQQAMYAAGTMRAVLDTMLEVGAHAGLSHDQVMTCINDPSSQDRLGRFNQSANQFNVTGTPTLILNGQKLEDPSALTYDGLSHILDQAIAARR